MAKYKLKPQDVTAYVIRSIGPRDEDGNFVPDADGNLTVLAGDDGRAETLPFTFAESEVQQSEIVPGDFVVTDGVPNTPILVTKEDFSETHVSA